MCAKRFTTDKFVFSKIYDEGNRMTNKEVIIMLNNLVDENEQLRKQLLICKSQKDSNGGFKVWQIPPIEKGTTTTITTNDGKK